MAVTDTVHAQVQADYGQFYVTGSDDDSDWLSDQIDGFGYEWSLWSKGRFAYVGTGGQHPVVELTVEVHDTVPDQPGPEWDHIASTSLETVGLVELCHWDPPPTPPAATLELPAGTYRMRVHWADLAAADRGDPEAITIQIWPEPWSETTLDRCWGRWWKPEPTDTSPDGRRQVEMGEQIQLRCAHLEPVGSFKPPPPTEETGWRSAYPPMPGGGPDSRCYHLKRDRSDASWWVAGVDVRETVREVTVGEAEELQQLPIFVPIPADHLQAWREHRERQRDR